MSIISFKNKYVFLKTKKVAGTSVEAVLRRFTGEEDIVPAVTPRDEYYSLMRGDASKNYLKNKSDEKTYTELVLAKRFDDAIKFLSSQKKLAVSHMNYRNIEKVIRRHGYNIKDFFVFTIDRHPTSWLLSSALYKNAEYNSKGKVALTKDDAAINKAVYNILVKEDIKEKINWAQYSENNKVLVDKVIDYDSLSTQLNEIFSLLGLDTKDVSLPDLKRNSRHLDPNKIINDQNRDRAKEVFLPLIKYMGYEM